MKSLIIGKKKINYVNQQGKQVEGYKVFVNSNNKTVNGLVASSYYIPKSKKDLYVCVENMDFSDSVYIVCDLDFDVDLENQKATLAGIVEHEIRKWEA